MKKIALALSLLSLSACTAPSSLTTADAPLSGGKADSGDRADRTCGVILRSFVRKLDAAGKPLAHDGWFTWVATVDVSRALADAGAVGEVLYRPSTAGDWFAFTGHAVGDTTRPFQTFEIEVSEGTTPTASMDLRSWEYQHAQLAVYAHASDGGRVFDHNRVTQDFVNYELTPSNDFQIGAAPGVCPAEPPKSVLVFTAPNGAPKQHGPILPGGKLTIEYALERLTTCRLSTAGYQLWDIEANVKFQPQGILVTRSVTQVVTPGGTGATRIASPVTLDVPLGTRHVEIWFRNFSGPNNCEGWDSNDSRNYDLPASTLPAPIGWAGDWGNGMSRACDHRAGLAEPVVIDEYIRERACTFIDGDVYVPGITDRDGGRLQDLWAQVEYSYDDGATSYAWLDPQGLVGNNQRYRWQLPYEVRMAARSFTALHFAFRFSNDGVHFFRIAQSAGPDGGTARTLVESTN